MVQAQALPALQSLLVEWLMLVAIILFWVFTTIMMIIIIIISFLVKQHSSYVLTILQLDLVFN